ncbi:unnamed protein product [Eruca vesicaria subsp. sativa]|uniref:HTH myb-type domain-containing protein n=1 Tax=Eruca vesicaria subsp. sativa TaxID=29727 RepID=A0ABC8KUA1_ERUVS|nr:unnamed protein product [Eruca vesicaria subsp. sativa]
MQNVSEHSASLEKTGGGDMQQLKEDADNNSFSANYWKSSRKRKQEKAYEQSGDDGKEDTSSLKKPRLAWSVELHQHFVDAVEQLGVDKAVPKKILEMMNVPGLTRENVASHLQKYRMYLRRLGGVSQHQGHTNHSFASAQDPNVGPISTLNGFNLQDLAVSCQLPAQSLAQLQASGFGRPSSSLTKPGMSVSPLVDQRSVFRFENPKIRFGHGHGHGQRMNSGGGGNEQMLHGVPTDHMPVQQQQQIASQNVHRSGMLIPVGGGGSSILPSLEQQQQMFSSSGSRRSDLTDAVVVRNSIPERRSSRVLPTTHSVFNNFPLDVHRNSIPLASAQGVSVPYQEGLTSSAATVTTTGFGLNDWDMPNIGKFFNSHQVTSAAASVEAYSSSSTQRKRLEADHVQSHHQQHQPAPSRSLNQMNQDDMNDGSFRVKSERVVETETFPPATTLFHEQYNQEDLISALLSFDGYSIDNISV